MIYEREGKANLTQSGAFIGASRNRQSNKPKMESSHCPWHAADLDGLYVVRDKNNKSIVEHSNEWTREEKVRHVLLMAAAPELLLSLCEMVLLAHDKTGEKGFETTPADWQIGIARAQKAIRNTEKSFQET